MRNNRIYRIYAAYAADIAAMFTIYIRALGSTLRTLPGYANRRVLPHMPHICRISIYIHLIAQIWT